jgi:succinate dehydrogenase/fumarate reductase cytochrome b subunit
MEGWPLSTPILIKIKLVAFVLFFAFLGGGGIYIIFTALGKTAISRSPHAAKLVSRKWRTILRGSMVMVIACCGVTYGTLRLFGFNVDGWLTHLYNLPKH